ncbi:MAG: HEAT repeat domain-containing protein [Vulcanimicrobiota bacterium]
MKKNLFWGPVLAFALAGCTQTPPDPTAATPTPVASTVAVTATATPISTPEQATFSAEIEAQATALAPKLLDSSSASAELRKQENGPAFVYLASSSDDPALLAVALQGMKETYSTFAGSKDKNPVDETYIAALLRNLDHSEKPVLYWALKAAQTTQLRDADYPQVAAKLNEIARNHSEIGARLEAIESLTSGGGEWNKSEDTLKTMAEALKAEPALASTAMFRMAHKSLGYQSELQPVLVSLLDHQDPGVRGRALSLVLVNVPEAEKQGLVEKVQGLLSDPHPFVRSQAASALAAARNNLQSVPKLMPLLADQAKNTYDISYPNLLGQTSRVHHDGSAWSRVDDATLNSLQRISGSMGQDKKFDYGKVNPKTSAEDIAREVTRAKEWFEKNKAEFS